MPPNGDKHHIPAMSEAKPAASDIVTDPLEERRLALEERKAQQDHEVKTLELSLKRAESGWVARLFTPLTTTIFAGILTPAASAVGTFMQGRSTLQLEREKFEANQKIEQQREQHELILKMVRPFRRRAYEARRDLVRARATAGRVLAQARQHLHPPRA